MYLSIYHGPDRRLHSTFGCTSCNYNVVYHCYYILTPHFHPTYMLSFPIPFPLSALFTSPSSSIFPIYHPLARFLFMFVFLFSRSIFLPPTILSARLAHPPFPSPGTCISLQVLQGTQRGAVKAAASPRTAASLLAERGATEGQQLWTLWHWPPRLIL